MFTTVTDAAPREIGGSPDESGAPASAPAITLRDAAVRVGGRTIWSDVSLDVARGEFVAILGPNGAGKSTLLNVLLGQLPLSHGVVRVLGRAPSQASREIGYVPQRRTFDASVRVRGIDMVRLGLDGMRWGFPLPGAARFNRRAAEDDRRVRQAIELVDASGYAQRPIGQVSGGEQQRLLIAQALVREPSMLMLDEPLESLDLPNQAAVAGLVERIARDYGVTVLMVVHDLNPILPYVDRVIYVAAGQALSGTPDEIITSETLSRLYGAPVEVLRARDGRLVVVGQPGAPHEAQAL
jgi:zinc/manganese transport system ATP-binding protein